MRWYAVVARDVEILEVVQIAGVFPILEVMVVVVECIGLGGTEERSIWQASESASEMALESSRWRSNPKTVPRLGLLTLDREATCILLRFKVDLVLGKESVGKGSPRCEKEAKRMLEKCKRELR